MKIKTISRSSETYVPVRNTQENAIPRNLNPALHPFERGREYTRALNATKLERMFAQPFVAQLGQGHRDGVYCLAKNFKAVNKIATGSGDGIVKYWDVTSREEQYSFKAHYGMVSGLVVTPDNKMLSCGSDKSIKLWDLNNETNYGQNYDDTEETSTKGLLKTFLAEFALQSMDHHRDEGLFVTGGAEINLWDENRSRPISNLSWGADNVTCVKFNQTETSIIASAGTDNSLILYDTRTNSATQKIKTRMRTNAISWNPMEAYIFATANEDQNGYLWDMRKMDRATNVYQDHVSAVMDIDFAPTGQEVVTGSYDKTIRIYRYLQGHSRDVYHTKRMQRVFITKFSMDSKYIFSGSDDGNIRIWRSKSNERSAPKSTRERNKLEYDEKLKERYASMPEIRRISRHRHLPEVIKKAQDIKRTEIQAIKRKEENERRHSKKGSVPYKSERERPVMGKVHTNEGV
ncbi:DEKNAAC104033 [Brettanomyces naardenensis]|uniref:DDB1- and CUL4-associated factor 13 n=1 Tax=Brettanomyces naardenensis TaxID=13370 RepID=A0A448YQD9_BRENA|nr:DEKNAAC104033 [Brettanomyces naardenensis]